MTDGRDLEGTDTLVSDCDVTLEVDDEDELDVRTPVARSPRYYGGAVLGRGGMGEVVAAFDSQIGRDVAIKRMREDAPTATARRFLREARIQARLDHPAIVPVYDVTADRLGNPFFVMKRLSGITLAEIFRRLNAGDAALAARFPRQRLLRAFVDVCLAIEFAHSRGVIHRDLKPENVMLGDFGEVYVLDWGIARVVDQPDDTRPITETQAGMMLGTPGYMAPEQVDDAADVDGRADVFALGAILFEILTGVAMLPTGTAGLAALFAGYEARPTMRGAAPPELDRVCVAATMFRVESRTPSARVLAEQIEAFLDGDRDSALRMRLVAANLHLARALADDERANALQAAGRALALDPTADEATALVDRLITEPPKVMPPELAAELAEPRTIGRRELAIAALYPIAMFGATTGALALPPAPLVTAGVCLVVLVAALVRRPTVWIAANALALGVLGWFGAPVAAVAVALVMARSFASSRFALSAAVLGAAAAVPCARDLTLAALAPASAIGVVAVGLGAYVARAAGREQREARRRIHVHAWQLRQLVGSRTPPASN